MEELQQELAMKLLILAVFGVLSLVQEGTAYTINWKAHFDVYDANKDGFIDWFELQAGKEKMVKNGINEVQLDILMVKVLHRKDKRVFFKEFILSMNQMPINEEEQWKYIFREVTTNSDLTSIMRNFGIETEAERVALLKLCDPYYSGLVNKSTLVKYFMNKP